MQLFTALSKVGLGGIACIRVGCVVFFLVFWGKYLNKEGLRSNVIRDFSAGGVTILAASGSRHRPQKAYTEGPAVDKSAPHYLRRKIIVHPQVYSPRNLSALERNFQQQRPAAAVANEYRGGRGSTGVTRLAFGAPLANTQREVPSFAEAAATRRITSEPENQVSSQAWADCPFSPPCTGSRTLQQNDTSSSFYQLCGLTNPLGHSESLSEPVSLLPLRRNIEFRTDTVKSYTFASVSVEAAPRDRLSFSSRPSRVVASKYTRELEKRRPSNVTEKQAHTASISNMNFARTRGSSERDVSSFLYVSGSSQRLLPWSSAAVPSACRYAGCKAGTFRGRNVSDKQDCFSFAHCSRCPLYPLGRVEFCSKLEEESSYLLLMQSTLQLMPEPVLAFHYRPSGVAEAATMREQHGKGEGHAAAGPSAWKEQGQPATEVGAEEWGEDEDSEPSEEHASLLQVRSHAAIPVHPPQLRRTPASVHNSRRNKRTQYSTAESFNSSLSEGAVTPRTFTLPSFLEDGETIPEAQWGVSEPANSEDDQWTEREVQLGEWEGVTGEPSEELGRGIPPKGEQPSEVPTAELLKFEQSRTFRVQQAEIRAHLSECATSAKGIIRLLLMFVFQPTRPKMSVQEARQRLGLFTSGAGATRAEEFGKEEQVWEEEEEAENAPGTDEGERPVPDDVRHPAYVQQRSFSDEQEGNRRLQASSFHFQRSPPPSHVSHTRPDSRSTAHSRHIGFEGYSNFTTESYGVMNEGISLGENHSAVPSPDAALAEECATSRLSLGNQPASLLQTKDKFVEEDNFEEEEWQPSEKQAPRLGKFFGRVKRLFRRRAKKDEGSEEPAPAYEREEEETEGEVESVEGRKGVVGRKARGSRVKRFFGKLLKKKTQEEKQELKEKQKATRVLVHAPRVHLEVAVISPAVRKCRKSLEWSGRLRLSTMLHVQYFISVRKAEIQEQLPGFINNALRVIIRCESKIGCIINRDLQSCVLVSCAKHKDVSHEAVAASSKTAEALARSQLKLAQTGSRGILSEEERAKRAAAFVKSVEEKQHAQEARQLKERQQILSVDEQQQMIHRQLVNFSTSKPDAMQRRLLEAIGVKELETLPVELKSTSPIIKEATHPVVGFDTVKLSKFSPPTSEERKIRLTPAAIGVISILSAAGVLGVGTTVYWWYLSRQGTAQRFLFRSSIPR